MTPDPDQPVQPDQPAPRVVGGRYRLASSIGRGGMGVVWSAHDELLDRQVAVKEVTYPSSLEEQQRAQLRGRTLREARAAARISSGAAVTVYDVVEEDGRPWIVMELLPARSLADVLREQGPLTPHDAARVGLRLLDALGAAHAAGVLHRDVKPANVLYDAAGQAVLTDFGIASLEGDASQTTTGAVIGSPGYVAPERAHGRPPSPASDLWSLGVTLATALHGRSPFERDTALATMVAAVQDPLPEQLRTGPLGDVVTALLRKDPAERPGLDEVRERLTTALAQGPGPDPRPPGTDETTPLPRTVPGPPTAPADGERTQALPPLPVGASDPQPVSPARPAAATGARPAARTTAPAAPGPAPAPVPTRRRRSRALPVVLAVVSLLFAGGALALLLDRQDPADLAADPAATPSASAPSEPDEADAADEATPGDDPAEATADDAAADAAAADAAAAEEAAAEASQAAQADAAATPAGFQVHEDPAFQVAVPEGWVVEPDGDTRTRFTDPGSRRYLLVEEGGEPAGDPVTDWEQQEPAVAERLDGYERISIQAADFRGFDAADWQFTWEASGGTLRVLNRAVVADDQAFALYWSVPQEEWDESLPVLDDIAASFQPAG
ncbi:protein kinase domain-containing protein [Aquipuribacter sp. MA13-6]|uniref:serine/threonine-protein kinase n=1 Tax=unclassified Aquipuribacter TaxID=2635084 RepID=UPI003EED8141